MSLIWDLGERDRVGVREGFLGHVTAAVNTNLSLLSSLLELDEFIQFVEINLCEREILGYTLFSQFLKIKCIFK